jgi:hypothetical protein
MAISEFQIALIGAGATAVVGVWAYNALQEYRSRKVVDKNFRSAHDDVLVEEDMANALTDVNTASKSDPVVTAYQPYSNERVEPVLGFPQAAEISVASFAEDVFVDMPSEDEVKAPEVAATAAAAAIPAEDCLDPVVEIAMGFPPEVDLAQLHSAWRGAAVDIRKRIRWIAREMGQSEWSEIDDPVRSAASHVYVAIQLADRQGAIDKNELGTFCNTAEAIAVMYGGEKGIPSLDEIIAHAHALDDVCASVDIQIALHIVDRAGQSFAGTKLRGLLEASGLQLAQDGLFYLLDADGRPLLSVSNSGAVPFNPEQMRSGTISNVTLWLDVPRVADGSAVFDIMLATARQLAEALDGVLVDDQRNPLSPNALAVIRGKILELQSQMASHGIPAGGRRALRLFA